MDRLKSILADKILELSSADSGDMKVRIEKIHRFRDFANACQTLMLKYPQIEDELIKMVNDGDFDTKIASSRVDNVIRQADTVVTNTVLKEEPICEEQEELLPEDITYEEVISTEDDTLRGYAAFEEVSDTTAQEVAEQEVPLTEEELASLKRKATMKKVLQIAGIIVAVVAIIFIVRFVMHNWQTILIVLAIALAVLAIVWYFKRKR